MEVAVYGTFMALIFVAALLHRLAGRISNPNIFFLIKEIQYIESTSPWLLKREDTIS